MLKIIHLLLCLILSIVISPSQCGRRLIRSINDKDFGKEIMDPYVLHQQLTNQILAQQALHLNEILRQMAFLHNNAPQAFYGDDNDNDGYESNYAAAAAFLGPDGSYQTAQILPENPDIPNIVNRFAETSPDGFKSVSVSSFSSSSDVNGKKSSSRFAETTINDNGQITTYRVHS